MEGAAGSLPTFPPSLMPGAASCLLLPEVSQVTATFRTSALECFRVPDKVLGCLLSLGWTERFEAGGAAERGEGEVAVGCEPRGSRIRVPGPGRGYPGLHLAVARA